MDIQIDTSIAQVNQPEAGKPGTVLVVGASGALGQSICECLADHGFDLLLTYRSGSSAVSDLQERLPTSVKTSSLALDLVDPKSVTTFRQRVDDSGVRLKAVVFACGAHIAQPRVADVELDEWRTVVEIELLGFASLARAFIPYFRCVGGGSFVNVVTFANYAYQVGDSLSSVPKAGVEALVRSIALEEGRHGIRANCVAPGIINAGLGAEFQETIHSPAAWQRVRSRVPMRRFGEAREVAQAVTFLVSDASSYITGNTLIVDGGMHL